jgi:hypothetical protein
MCYRARPCPSANCTEYKLREAPRSWQIFTARELRRASPREENFVLADCGHEVYSGERTYEKDGSTLCGDCVEDELGDLSIGEKAQLLGYEPSGEVR